MHLLVVLTVLLCGSHMSPAEADTLTDHAAEAHGHAAHGDDLAGDPHAGAADASHHHCPIAPDPHAGAPCRHTAPVATLLFEPAVARLSSLATSPPTQPPAA
jgi:hypothetical protein